MLWIALLSLGPLAFGEASPSICYSYSGTVPLPISSAFSACISLSSVYDSCTAAPKTKFDSCFCNQIILNDIANCANEKIECQIAQDNQAKQLLSIWHKQCDGHIKFTPTTPAITASGSLAGSPTVSLTGYCSRVNDVCSYGIAQGEACFSSYPLSSQSGEYLKCACQQPLISAASVCEYDGNKTCFGEPAALSNIPQFQSCPTQDISSFLAAQSTGPVPGIPTTPAQGKVPSLASATLHSGGIGPTSTSTKSNAPVRAIGSIPYLNILLIVQITLIVLK